MNRNASLKSALIGAALLIGLGTASAFAQQVSAIDDSALAEHVMFALARDSKLDCNDLGVRVEGGRVVLFGKSDSEQVAEAYRTASSVPGVKSVSNHMSVTDISA